MNHYERLKVSRDAPAEVIRAAYRALAAKLHPDRQGPDTSPLDATHSQMAALNAAYETLIDPKLRQDYDATLAPAHEGAEPGEQGESRQGPSTRVDLDWLPPQVKVGTGLWPPSVPVMVIGGSLVAGVLLGMGWFVWQMMGDHQIERALSDQYAAQPPGQRSPQDRTPAALDAEGMPPLPADKGAATRKPTVDELSRMSDEELVKALPTLDKPEPATPPARRSGASGAASQHPLDGKPLRLRNDMQLIDPLAPEPAGKHR